jgi:hypothetical protein
MTSSQPSADLAAESRQHKRNYGINRKNFVLKEQTITSSKCEQPANKQPKVSLLTCMSGCRSRPTDRGRQSSLG